MILLSDIDRHSGLCANPRNQKSKLTSAPVMSLVERVAKLEAENDRLRKAIVNSCMRSKSSVITAISGLDIVDVTLMASVVALILVVGKALQ